MRVRAQITTLILAVLFVQLVDIDSHLHNDQASSTIPTASADSDAPTSDLVFVVPEAVRVSPLYTKHLVGTQSIQSPFLPAKARRLPSRSPPASL